MSERILIARILLTALAASQGAATVLIDLNRTHATHPLWPGHARFHVVWQTLTQALSALLAVLLLWLPGHRSAAFFYIAAAITALSMLGFVGAAVSRRLYRGTFHDTGGIPPLPVRFSRRSFMLDMNTVAVSAGLLVLAASILICYFAA